MSKRILIITIFMLLLATICIPTTTFATSVKTWDQMKQDLQNFEQRGQATTVINNDTVRENILPIAQILVAVASGVLGVVTCILGLKYATVGGSSAETKAKLKKQLVGLVVSIIVVFGAQAIWAIIYNLMSNI